jgi:hypothetical protein
MRWLPIILLAACTPDFVPASFLDEGKIRVLAVVPSKPEVAAGETTNLTLVFSPGFEDASVEWAACFHPAFPGGGLINTDCLDENPQSYLVPAGSGPSIDFTMPAGTTPQSLGTPDATTGFYLPIRFIAQKGDQKIIGFYRLRLYLGFQPPNTNPRLSEIDHAALDRWPEYSFTPIDVNTPFPVAAGTKVTLRALIDPTSIETYMFVSDLTTMALSTQSELIRVKWYTTAGTFSEDVTGATQPLTELDLSVRPPPSLPADVPIFAIALDERGGEASYRFTLLVQ